MDAASASLFGSRAQRGYDAEAVKYFPWPVVAAYDDIHRWMDHGQEVAAAWQVRDAWEGLIKFLGTLATADYLAGASPGEPRTTDVLSCLLKPRGLSLGDWPALLRLTLIDVSLDGRCLPELAALVFPPSRPKLWQMTIGDQASFVSWRNRRFGHGVFSKDLCVFAEEALHWLDRLHEAYDLCRPFFSQLRLTSEASDGEPLTWGSQSPLHFYHGHQSTGDRRVFPPVWVRGKAGRPLSLFPLLSVQCCDVCGQWAAFYLDKYEPSRHRAWFLDFVEGHSQDRRNLDPLRAWSESVPAGDTKSRGAAPTAAEDRRGPDPERFRDFAHEFEPPVYLARRVAEFLRGHDRGVIRLSGPAGAGKSWGTRGLDQAAMLPAMLGRAVPALHLAIQCPHTTTAGELKTELAGRARQHKHWLVPPEPSAPTSDTRFAGWLAALMRTNGLGELLVTVDGLDELPADSDGPDLFPCARDLPPGCYLVLSGRPGLRPTAERSLQRVRSTPEYYQEVTIGPADPDHREVLRGYVARRLASRRPDGRPPLPANWIEPLIDQAEGSFLYTFHYCRALHFGVYADLSHLPAPSAYYPAFFAHLRARVGEELFEACYVRGLALIGVARQPLGLTHLVAWGLERGRLSEVLADFADLLRSRREPWDPETLYSLGHEAIRQFLQTDPQWQAHLADAERFLVQQAFDRYSADWSAADPTDAVTAYLLFHLLDHAVDATQRERALGEVSLARACLEHGTTLGKDGNFESALLAFNLAARLLSDQVDRQGRRDLRTDWADALMHCGDALDELGRLEESRQRYEFARELLGQLVHAEGRLEARPALAGAHWGVGNALRNLGTLAPALQSYDTAIDLYQVLRRDDPAGDCRADLANTLVDRGFALRLMGSLEEALETYARGIELYEVLVEREGRVELRANLATAYMNRGVALDAVGRLEPALASYAAAIVLLEALTEREGHRSLRALLATACMNRGVALTNVGRLDEALLSHAACIQVYLRLVKEEGHSEFRPMLATAYLNQGKALREQGRLNEALTALDASVEVYDRLAQHEGRKELRRDLAKAHMNRGVTLRNLGRFQEALQAYTACIRLGDTLVQQERHRELRPDLAMAYLNRGVALDSLSRPTEALSSYAASIALFEVLVMCERRPELRPELATAHMNRGVALRRLGRTQEALQAYAASIALLELLVRDEGRDDLRSSLADAYLNRANALRQVGRRREALAAVSACTELYHRLARDEGRQDLVADLSWANAVKAEVLLLLGERKEAAALAQQSLNCLRDEMARTGRAELQRVVRFTAKVLQAAVDG